MSNDVDQLRNDVNWLMRQLGQLPTRVAGGGGSTGKLAEYTAEDRATLLGKIVAAAGAGKDVEGAFGRTTGTVKRAYRYLGELLICYTHLESS